MRWRYAARVLALVSVVGAGPALAHAAPGTLSPVRAFILASGACFVAMALSLNVLSGHAGLPSLGHGALLAVGALTSGLATGRWYLPFAAGVALAAVVTAAVALAVAVPAVRLGAASFALVTLALGLVLEQSLFRWRWLTRGATLLVLPRPQVGSFVFDRSGDYLAVAAGGAVLAWVVEGRLARSSLGRAVHLVRDDERAAQAVGIDPLRSRVVAFVISGALAGVAGAIFGHLVIAVSADTFRYSAVSLPLLGLVVIAGSGSRAAVAVVSLLYAVMPRLLAALRGWDAIIAGLLFLFTVVRNPAGLAGTVRRARRRRMEPAQVHPRPFAALPLPVAPPSAAGDRRTVLSVSELDVDRGATPVLRGVSLVVPVGRVVALVGPNGAGKTTLLDAVSGFVPCRAGSIVIQGRDVTVAPAHRRRALGVGRTFQRLGLPPGTTVTDALLVARNVPGVRGGVAELLGMPAARRRQRHVAEATEADLDRLGLSGFGQVPVGELSVGQQRLVELSAALAGDQQLLLLDEPSAGLAPVAVEAVASQIRSLRDAGHSVLLVEHDLRLVGAVSDHVVVLMGGRLVAEGTAAEVFAAPDVVTAWLGTAPPP